MKICFLIAILAVAAWAVRGQGTVNFANGAAGVNARVTQAVNGLPVEGADWHAELLVSEGESLKRIGGPVPFATQTVTGYFFGGIVTVPGVEPGQQATFRIRVYGVNSAAEGLSPPVTVTLGGEKMPPANLVGLEPWAVKPPVLIEYRLAITRAGNQVVLSWPGDLTNAVLQATESLEQPSWSAMLQTPQIEGGKLTVSMPIEKTGQYFRLRVN